MITEISPLLTILSHFAPKCKVLPPQSMMGPITDDEKKKEILISNLYLKYQNEEDRDSAYEFFQRMTREAEIQAAQEAVNGVDNTNGAKSFRQSKTGRAGLVIGGHVFF